MMVCLHLCCPVLCCLMVCAALLFALFSSLFLLVLVNIGPASGLHVATECIAKTAKAKTRTSFAACKSYGYKHCKDLKLGFHCERLFCPCGAA